MPKSNWPITGCAVAALWLTAAIAAQAQTFKRLHSFDSTDGALPFGALAQGSDGNLYGTTLSGGAIKFCGDGCGTVFKITPSGTLTTLYQFCSTGSCLDGAEPFAGLLQATDGNLYGTTESAGTGDTSSGTVFKITPTGVLTTLHSFDGADGAQPLAAIIQASDGNFYGTTSSGGINTGSCQYGGGCGTVFKITPSGILTTLHSFDGFDGDYPAGALVQASDGNLYGTTNAGGPNGFGSGTVFRITLDGTLTTLYDFCYQSDCSDGFDPYAGLVQGTDGNLYGTTSVGGVSSGGTVFKITLDGTLTKLYDFCSQNNCSDGSYPHAGLVQADDGNFYGTTLLGGVSGGGTIFKITPNGTLTTLHDFCAQRACVGDSANAYAALLQDTDGSFYGATATGGVQFPGHGSIYGLLLGLGEFVETRPTAGSVGAPVEVLGIDLKGTTSVTFNGTATTFRVLSNSLIGATVPAGATTGRVQVVTQSGTLTSNANFQVLP